MEVRKKRIIGKIGPELILEEPVRLKLLVERHFNKKKNSMSNDEKEVKTYSRIDNLVCRGRGFIKVINEKVTLTRKVKSNKQDGKYVRILRSPEKIRFLH